MLTYMHSHVSILIFIDGVSTSVDGKNILWRLLHLSQSKEVSITSLHKTCA